MYEEKQVMCRKVEKNQEEKPGMCHIVQKDQEEKPGMCHIVSKDQKKSNDVKEDKIDKSTKTAESNSSNQSQQIKNTDVAVIQPNMGFNQNPMMFGVEEQEGRRGIEFNEVNHILYMDGKPMVNFRVTLTKMRFVCKDTKENYKEVLVDGKCEVWSMNQNIIYSFEKVSLEELKSRDFLKRMPFAVSFCKKSELNDFMYKYGGALVYGYKQEIVHIFETSGWKEIGRNLKAYVTAQGVIGFPQEALFSNDGFCLKDTHPRAAYPEFMEMRKTLNRPEQMDIILLYTLGQFIHTLFEDANMGLKHILFIVGDRGSGKTAISLCFTQLENKNAPKFNFQATESGLHANLMYYRDRVMLIDDLAPSSDNREKKDKEHKLESIIRLFGDGTQRIINTNFMKGNAENIDYSVYGGAVITGEYFYGTGSESSIARAVVVKLGKESVNWERLTYFQNNPQILESVIHRFLNYIGHNYERSINVIKDTVNSYRDSIPNTLFSNKRYCDYCGQYMAVGIMLMDFFKEESGITELEKSEYLIQLRENILKVLAENDSDMRQTAPINGIIQSIIYYWDAGKYGSWGNQITEQTPLILGKNGDTIFFRQKDLPEIQKQYAHKVNIPYYSMSSSQMGNLLASNGYCEKYKEGKQERLGKKYSEYGNERLMSIPIHKIVEFQQTMQCDY